MTVFNIISLSIILICVILILRIIVKKFPVLAVMDVESIPGKKEARFKEQIVRDRLHRNFIKRSSFIYRILKFGYDFINKSFKNQYDKLQELKNKYKTDKAVKVEDRQDKINQLMLHFQEMKQAENRAEAESALIEIIGIDDGHLPAFVNLAELYFEDRKYAEAKETLQYVLQVSKKQERRHEQAEANYDLARIIRAEDNYKEAIELVRQALDLIPNNPRYLDMLAELAILEKDKVLAHDAFEKLTQVNPENQKLEELKNRIVAL